MPLTCQSASFGLVQKDFDQMLTLESFPPLILVFCCVPFSSHISTTLSTLLGPRVKADLNLILLGFAQSYDCRWVAGHLSLGSRSVDNVGTQLITWWWWWWRWWWWWDIVDHMVTGYTNNNLQQFWKTWGPLLGWLSVCTTSSSANLMAWWQMASQLGQVATGNMALS